MQTKYPRVRLKPKREYSVRRGHPWIFSGAIESTNSSVSEGAVVAIDSYNGEALGVGHYCHGSIAIKMLSSAEEEINQAFYNRKITEALSLRELLKNPSTTAYRLINAEGDQLPGLIVDLYGDTAVIQPHSLGMFQSKDLISQAVLTTTNNEIRRIYIKPEKDQLEKNFAGYIIGNAPNSNTVILENGLKFSVNWETGQKTGFYIDQRENRQLIQRLSNGKRVLNTFCYTGGFSIYALAGGAKEVISVDSSTTALEQLNENIKLNNINTAHRSIKSDCFDYLNQDSEKFDLVILDPPAFAKRRSALSQAVKGYTSLNASAMRHVKDGGLLATFSCSQVVTRDIFEKSIHDAALREGRQVVIISRLTQSMCHPISIYHPEGEYLKGLLLQIR